MKLRNFFAIVAGTIFAASAARAEPGAWKSADESTRNIIAGEILQGIYPAPVPSSGEEGFSIMSFTPSEATDVTPEIQALARGLKKDAWGILQYCSDRIRHEAYWGSKKGAALTLLEGSGNSFDIAALMVALLREAGYQDVEFRYGLRIFSEQELEDWLGLISPLSNDGAPYPDSTDAEIRQKFGLPSNYPLPDEELFTLHKIDFLTLRGYPYLAPSGSDFKVPHVWVTFRDAQGTMREVDPSFKFLDRYSFEVPAPSTFGYNRTTFLNNLGGSLTDSGRQISGIGVTTANGLNNQLSSFTNQFRTWLKTHHADASTDEFINRGYPYPIQGPITAHYLSAGTDYDSGSTAIPVTSWNEIPSLWETKVKFTFGQAYNATSKTFGTLYQEVEVPTNALGGRKLSLSCNGTTVDFRLDEESLASFTAPPATVQIEIAINHPGGYIDDNGTFVDDGWLDDDEVKTYARNDSAAYAIIYGFDSSAEHLRKSQERLDRYRKSGLGDGDWEVKTESLNVMGLNWMAQKKLVDNIVCTRTLVLPLLAHCFGRVSQEGTFYIDVGLSRGSFLSYSARKSTKLLKFHVADYFGSALEHGILEQTQGPSVDALSTIRVIQLANAQSVILHLANSSNWTSVRNTLDNVGNNWPNSALDRIASQITGTINTNNAATVLVPRRANIGMTATPATDKWRGYGYVLNSKLDSGYYISGGYADGTYSGGYSNNNSGNVSSNSITRYGNSEPGYYTMDMFLNGTSSDHMTVPRWAAADPVDMASGAFLFDNTDLQIGGPLPRGLSFHRSYHSNRADDSSAGLGNGWTHNLNIRATRRSAARAAMGDSTMEQMAATYVAVSVALDVYANKANAKDWAVTALTAGWGIDQMRDNGVSINMGGPTLEFVRMPDGSFVPPAGITMTLTEGAGGTLVLAERHGNTHHFDTDGRITSTIDQHSNEALFAYKEITVAGVSKTVLDTVTDMHDREIQLTWEGGLITGVAETAGALTRSVGFLHTGGNLTTVTDPEGKTFGYGYDQDRMISLTDGRDRVIVTNEYDEQGKVYRQKLHGNADNTFDLFISGYRNIERNPEGGETVFIYDRQGRGIATIDPTGHRASITYDGQNRKIETASPKNNGSGNSYRPTTFTFNADHNLTTAVVPNRNAADNNGPYTAQQIYDGQLRLWKDYDFKGKFTEYTYTSEHQVHQVKDREGQLVRTNAYNTDGTLASVTDAAGQVTKYLDYDSFGNPQTIEYPAVTVDGVTVTPSETFGYDARGNLLEHTDRNGNTTTTTYNERRQPRLTTLPAVDGVTHTRETEYDDAGNASRVRDGRGNWTAMETSQTGKLLSTKLPSTAAGTAIVTTNYDSRDWPEWTRDPQGRQTTYGYDATGRVISVTDPLTRVSRTFYNSDGEAEETRDARDKSTFFRHNWRGELYETENALAHSSSTVFDKNGWQDSFTNKRGKTFGFSRDENGRLLSLTTPLLKQTTRGWTTRGLLDQAIEPSLDRADFTYDNMGRSEQTVYKRGTTTLSTVTRHLDKQGNLKKLTELVGTTTVQLLYPDHDSRNRLRTFTDARGNTIGYRHDGAGNLVELIYPGNKGSVLYTYDSNNRMETVTDWASRVTRYHYDLNGRVTRVERDNGTSRRYAWDPAGQMRGVSEIASNGQPLYYAVNRHDDAGRRDQEIVFPALQPHTAPAFTAIYDDDNRLTSFNGTSTALDDDGNLTTGPLVGVASAAFVYDSRNRLTSAGGLGYSYDPAGHRIGVTAGTIETQWTIDSSMALSRALVREKSGDETWYVYGLGLLYEVDEDGDTSSYHYDARGSTVAITADDGQTVLDRFNYDSYGRETWRQASFDTPFRYNGEYGVQTDTNGLLHMRARFYNPLIRRFLNADPIGFEGGSNWFAYANGNPVSLSDPFGLCADGGSCTGGYGYGNAWTQNELGRLALATEVALGFTPIGVAMDIYNFSYSAGQGDYAMAGMGLIAFLPFGDLAKGLKYMDEVAEQGDEFYEIGDGVRRTKAAQMAGNTHISANVFDDAGQFVEIRDIPIDQLLSPNKSVIDVRNLNEIERFASIHDATLKGVPLPPISVTPGSSGVSIPEIKFNYGQ